MQTKLNNFCVKKNGGYQYPPPPKKKKETRWFKVTFLAPGWRPLNPWKGHLMSLNHPRKVTKKLPGKNVFKAPRFWSYVLYFLLWDFFGARQHAFFLFFFGLFLALVVDFSWKSRGGRGSICFRFKSLSFLAPLCSCPTYCRVLHHPQGIEQVLGQRSNYVLNGDPILFDSSYQTAIESVWWNFTEGKQEFSLRHTSSHITISKACSFAYKHIMGTPWSIPRHQHGEPKLAHLICKILNIIHIINPYEYV